MSSPGTVSNALEEEAQIAAAEPPEMEGCQPDAILKKEAIQAVEVSISSPPRPRSNSIDSCASSARSDDGKGYEEDHEGEDDEDEDDDEEQDDDEDEIPSLPLLQPLPSRPVSCVRAPCLKRNPNLTLAVDSGAESAASASPAFGASACSSMAGSLLLLPPPVSTSASAPALSSAIPSSFAAPRSFSPSGTTLRSLTPLSTITGPSLTTASANANFDVNVAVPISASSSTSCMADISTGALSANSLRSLSFSSACSTSTNRHVRFDSGPPEAGVTHSGKHYDRRPIETTHGTGSDLDLSLTRCSTLHDDVAEDDDAAADDASTRDDDDDEANAHSDDANDDDDDRLSRAGNPLDHVRSASADQAEASDGEDGQGRVAASSRGRDTQRRRRASADDGDAKDERYLSFKLWAREQNFKGARDEVEEETAAAHREELERITSRATRSGDSSSTSSRRSSSSSSSGGWSAPRVMRIVQSGTALAPAQPILGHAAASSTDPSQAALPVHGIRAFGGLASAAGSSPTSAGAIGALGRRRKCIPPLVEGRKLGLHDPSWDEDEDGDEDGDVHFRQLNVRGNLNHADDEDEQEILQDEERDVPPRTTASPFSEAMSRLGGSGAYGSSRRSPNATPKPSPSVRPRWEKVCGYFEVAPVTDAAEDADEGARAIPSTSEARAAPPTSAASSLTVDSGASFLSTVAEPTDLLPSSAASLSGLSPAAVSPSSSSSPSPSGYPSPTLDTASGRNLPLSTDRSVSPLSSQASCSDSGAAMPWSWSATEGTSGRERLSAAGGAHGSSSSGDDSAGSSTVDSLLMQEPRASRQSRPSNLGHGSRSASAVSVQSTASSSVASASHGGLLQQPHWRMPDATGSGFRSPRSPCEMSASDGLCSSAATSPELGPVSSPRGKSGLSVLAGTAEDEDAEERRCFLSPTALSTIWSGGNFVKSNRLASGDVVSLDAAATEAVRHMTHDSSESPLSSGSPNDDSQCGAGNLVEIPCLSPNKLLPPSLLASRRRQAQLSRNLAAAAAVAAGCGAQLAGSATASASVSPSMGGTPLTGTSASASASGMTSDESPALSETEGLPLPPQQSSNASPAMSDDKLLAPPTPAASTPKKKRSSSRREGSSGGSSSRDKEGRRSASSGEARGASSSSSSSSGKPRRSSMGSSARVAKLGSGGLESGASSSFFGSCSGFDEGALGGF